MASSVGKALCAIMTIGLVSGAAHAETDRQGKMNIGDFYAGVSAGVIVPEDIKTTVSGSIANFASSGSGNYTFTVGPSISASAGYHLSNYLAAEAEIGYAVFWFKSLRGTLTVGANSATGSIGVDGNIENVTGFANAILTPLGRTGFWGVTPYVGGGLGLAHTSREINSFTVNGTTYAVSEHRSGTNLAADAILGFDYAASDKFSFGGRYRYMWVKSGRSQTSSGLTETTGDSSSHSFVANAAYHF